MDVHIEWLDQVDSTNVRMREAFMSAETYANGTVIAAREQTAGRGRQGRTWISTVDTNLYFSLFIKTDAPLVEVPSLTMAASLAITECLTTHGIPAVPKWPNDVLVDEKKICGILSERVSRSGKSGIIVGIGLNVNMTHEQASIIEQPATSMFIETGQTYDLPETLNTILKSLTAWSQLWLTEGFAGIRTIWTEKTGPLGKPLCVRDGTTEVTGTLAGFGNHGELLLQTDLGIKTIWSGDVA